jgi:hypothetical protein
MGFVTVLPRSGVILARFGQTGHVGNAVSGLE